MNIISFKANVLHKLEEAKKPIKEELSSRLIIDLPHQRLLAGQIEGIKLSQQLVNDYFKEIFGDPTAPEEKKAIY